MSVDSTQSRRQQMLASTTVLGVLAVLLPIAVGVARHPASVQGAGSGLLRMDVGLLLAYGIAGVWVWYQRRSAVGLSIRVGAQFGVRLGAGHVANHALESFVSHRAFVLVISPVFLMLALFGAAGSTLGNARARSVWRRSQVCSAQWWECLSRSVSCSAQIWRSREGLRDRCMRHVPQAACKIPGRSL